jgi:LacI family xylobiose transport system transcriptional regulator
LTSRWERLLARRPQGIIVVHSLMTPEEHGQLAASGIPLVAIDPMGDPRHAAPSVCGTNWNGGVTAAQHVLDLGHRRIAVMTGPLEYLCARARLEACRATLEGAGSPLDGRLIRTGHFLFDDGLRMAEELLSLPQRPTAILCGNDLQALGVYEAARRLGLRVPQDLSVVGFDDMSDASWSAPPLTTIRQPFGDMGAVATQMLVSLVAGEPAKPRVELATSLVVRGSTARPPR